MAFIYLITNQINGKRYVGKTTDTIESRWKNHIRDSKKNRCKDRALYRAFHKYGIENFKIEQLEECSAKEASQKESFWIDKLGTFQKEYNETKGGDGKLLYDYKEIADKYLELKSVTKTANYFNCDLLTVRKACREFNIKILPSWEVCKNQYPNFILMLDKNTEEVLKVFNNPKEIDIFFKKDRSSSCVTKVCRGKGKTAYGYKWKFKAKE